MREPLREERYVRSGKVRDLFQLNGQRLLLVASDRISAFDVVLPTPIPDKGRVLTGLSRYWFREIEVERLVATHLISTDPHSLPETFRALAGELRGRMMICAHARVLPVEIVVRGYLAGSGWRDYRERGSVCGIRLPAGLRESEQLPQPLFTPSTKAESGHDENIGFDELVDLVGAPTADTLRTVALAIYRFAASRLEPRGIILADTKFEFGILPAGDLVLIDEALTPDSSRFWDASRYQPGRSQASFDKQFVRDWLETRAWDKRPPGPELPLDVVEATRERYVAAFERITGGSFARYLAEDVIEPEFAAVIG